jgi:peptidoglycan biosynthesis protein MviN/MurJ (putative lipid II flippase)
MRAGPSARALAGTLLGNVPGLLLPFLITARLHAGRLTDAYFYAFAIAIFATGVVSLALEANVLPLAEHHRRRGTVAFRAFARRLVVQAVGAMTAAYLVIGAVGAATVLVRSNWTAAQQTLCVELIGLFAIAMAAVAATSVLGGCLYAFGGFFVTRLTLGLRSLLPVPVLFLAPRGATALLLSAGALALGELVRAGLLSRRLRALSAGLATEPVRAAEPPPRSVWSTALPYGLAMVLFAANPVIDRVVAGSLDPGSVTVLDLAEKVFFAPVTIVVSAVMLVSGARWAALLLDRPEAVGPDYRATLRRSAWLSLALTAAVALPALGVAAATDATLAGIPVDRFCAVLAILMAGFPAAVLTNAGVRLLSVLRRTERFPALALASFAACVLGDLAGAALLGIPGIALAGTCWRAINLVLFLRLSFAALGRVPGGAPVASPAVLSIRLETP